MNGNRRRMGALAAVAVAAALSMTACAGSGSGSADAGSASMSAGQEPSMAATMDSTMEATTMASGEFKGLNGKTVQGMVEVKAGMVDLSGFSSDEGPDLHVYLTSGTTEADVSAGTELGAVKFDEAEQSFMLPDGAATSGMDVVIHCDKAKAVFGAAELTAS